MTNEKIRCGDDVIDRNTPQYKECIAAMIDAARTADKIIGEVKPSLFGDRYFTSAEIMDKFHISRRALQNYRDNATIPHTAIGGTILYPESKIREVLEKNYYHVIP